MRTKREMKVKQRKEYNNSERKAKKRGKENLNVERKKRESRFGKERKV
jgi:hypothetical protein